MRVFEHLRPFVKVIFDGFKRLKLVKCDPKSLKIILNNFRTQEIIVVLGQEIYLYEVNQL